MLFGRLKNKRPCGAAVKNMDSEFRLHDFLAALTWPANLIFCFLPVKQTQKCLEQLLGKSKLHISVSVVISDILMRR